jgi:hypothetical protein
MKKLFIIATLVCTNCLFAQTQETTEIRKQPTTNAPTREPRIPVSTELELVVNINNTESNPLPPSKTIIAEVEESEQPNLLNELKTLREDKQELLARVKQLQSEKADIKEDFDVATKQIQEFIAERSELRSSVKELRDTINKGPGSLFKGWVYSQELDWVYVSPTIVPYSYSQKNGWMLYQYGSNPRRVFYFETESWERLDKPMITESNQER